MVLRIAFVGVFCLGLFGGIVNDSFARPARPVTGTVSGFLCKDDCDRTTQSSVVQGNDYQTDIDRLIALRSHALDELIALSNQMETKWRRVDWNLYAGIMKYICSEISNRGLNDERVREQSERFARVALTHSNMYSWEHESALVGWLGYQRSNSNVNAWPRDRRVKAEFWLHPLRRLERETDPNFDINDRQGLPAMRVYPPVETGLPVGTPPTAIKDARLRAKYETAITENKKKSQRVNQQLPLLLHGRSFKTRAERWLIQAYSQPPARNAELKRYLQIYIQNSQTRQKILTEVERNSK